VRRILLLANPLFRPREARYLPQITDVFEQAGLEVQLAETGPYRAAGERARDAVDGGIDAVMVCGGDGTIFDVVQGLAGSEVPIGILPFGTGNVLAQNLKIPIDPVEAARWLLSAQPRSVPLGKITVGGHQESRSWYFAMAAGMGLHAAMMDATRRMDKDRTGRAAYFAGGFRVLLSHPIQPFELEVTTVDGKVVQRVVSDFVAVHVAELNLWRPGGSLDSPFLRLASVPGDSRWRLAQAAVQALFQGAGQRNGHAMKGQSAACYEDVLKIECRPIAGMNYSMPISVEADGEILGATCATIEMAGLSVKMLSGTM
jgi:diacylglycerol kinase family enzyme